MESQAFYISALQTEFTLRLVEALAQTLSRQAVTWCAQLPSPSNLPPKCCRISSSYLQSTSAGSTSSRSSADSPSCSRTWRTWRRRPCTFHNIPTYLEHSTPYVTLLLLFLLCRRTDEEKLLISACISCLKVVMNNKVLQPKNNTMKRIIQSV